MSRDSDVVFAMTHCGQAKMTAGLAGYFIAKSCECPSQILS